jgi:hypothetical protein
VALTTIPSAGAKLRASVLSSLITELRPITARMSVNQTLTTSSTTLQNLTELVAAVVANATYDFTLIAAATVAAGTTEDVKYSFTWPTGATADWYSHGPATTLAAGTTAPDLEAVARLAASSGSDTTAFGLTTSNTSQFLHGRLVMSSTAGNLQVQAAQNTSGGNAVTVKAGSRLILVRVA